MLVVRIAVTAQQRFLRGAATSSEVRVRRPSSRGLLPWRHQRDRSRSTGGGISSAVDEAIEPIRLLPGTEAAEYFVTVIVTG
jgi:hypothetical protein